MPRSLVSTNQVPWNEAARDRPSMKAIEEGRSHSSFSGSQHADGWQSGSLPTVIEDFFTLGAVAEWGTKRGMETQSLELSTSPLKKFRGLSIEKTSKGRVADLWRSMSFKETCLVVERAIF
ncbi:hypothetical protein C1H46_019627 [Malus baccata]|uniref:Uncharacterized protein n=1 Tax=Malus baccata TaxID=106549 RepID=A0A540M7P4_MALBA|nr:hypothetical protein C1H46_019627 [Malus baccata]